MGSLSDFAKSQIIRLSCEYNIIADRGEKIDDSGEDSEEEFKFVIVKENSQDQMTNQHIVEQQNEQVPQIKVDDEAPRIYNHQDELMQLP